MGKDEDLESGQGAAAGIDRALMLDIARVTESAAIAAARLRGRGDELAADAAAASAMLKELNALPVTGKVVIGEGDEDDVSTLYLGETVGTGAGPELDVAVDPLEGTTVCAKAMPGALSVLAVAEAGTLLHAPGIYMNKIAVGPGYPAGIIDLDAPPADNLGAVAEAKGVPVAELTVCILDRPRHAGLIEGVREAGAAVRLIGDGDIAGIINTTEPEETGIDLYMGIGGAPEGVLAAAAMRCIGGQMQGRLHLKSQDDRLRATAAGIEDIERKYTKEEMVRGDVVFAATGVTDGSILAGVRFRPERVETETVVMRASTRTVRFIRTRHPNARAPKSA